MEPEVGRSYRVVIEHELENPWIGKNGAAHIGEVDVAIPNAKSGEAYEVRVLGVAVNPWTKRRQARVEILDGARRSPLAALEALVVDFASPESLGALGDGFRKVGDHYVLVKRRPRAELAADRAYIVGEEGIAEVPPFSAGLRINRAGVPHRMRLLHGYWHINPRDELVLLQPEVGTDDVTVVMIEKAPTRGEVEAIAWFCLGCAAPLHRVEYPSNADGGPLFDAAAEGDSVAAFNADVALRTCRRCGAVHPLAYRVVPALNPPDAEAARGTW